MISYEEVATAAEKLFQAGKSVEEISIEAIRKDLGGGSRNNILEHLRAWKTKFEENLQITEVPPELKIAWLKAINAEAQKANTQSEALKAKINELENNLAFSEDKNEQLTIQLQDAEAKAQKMEGAQNLLTKEIDALKVELDNAKAEKNKLEEREAQAKEALEENKKLENNISNLSGQLVQATEWKNKYEKTKKLYDNAIIRLKELVVSEKKTSNHCDFLQGEIKNRNVTLDKSQDNLAKAQENRDLFQKTTENLKIEQIKNERAAKTRLKGHLSFAKRSRRNINFKATKAEKESVTDQD